MPLCTICRLIKDSISHYKYNLGIWSVSHSIIFLHCFTFSGNNQNFAFFKTILLQLRKVSDLCFKVNLSSYIALSVIYVLGKNIAILIYSIQDTCLLPDLWCNWSPPFILQVVNLQNESMSPYQAENNKVM